MIQKHDRTLRAIYDAKHDRTLRAIYVTKTR